MEDDFLEDFAPLTCASELQGRSSQEEDDHLRYDATPAEVVQLIEQFACDFCEQLGMLGTVPDLVLKRECSVHCLLHLCASIHLPAALLSFIS